MERRFSYNRKENKTMIQKTIYVAFDGKEFDDEDDCREYELNTKLKDVGDDLLLYDKNGKKIEKIDNQLLAESIDYIVIKSEKAYEYFVEQMDYFGLNYPDFYDSPICSYYYDYDENEWINIEDRVQCLQLEIDKLSKYLIK